MYKRALMLYTIQLSYRYFLILTLEKFKGQEEENRNRSSSEFNAFSTMTHFLFCLTIGDFVTALEIDMGTEIVQTGH